MDSPSAAPPQPAATSTSAPPPTETAAKRDEREKEMMHRTKVIQFLGRTAPIILQNDNGPCPLLAICNVLSLKNSLNLSPDIPEVSQEKLLSLVAERLIDSNSNIDNKDSGYVENQQQNIADAIDLLPRLTTGIDVNIKFRRIDDFEFTRECAIFDLLDIPLYHGWIVDPQDHETAEAIGSKSYNTLMGELVSLETHMEIKQKKSPDDDDVDFVAATTAALGVPSPSLSRGQSFDECSPKARKGDIEEEAELLRVLKLSEVERDNISVGGEGPDVNIHESAFVKKSELPTCLGNSEKEATNGTVETETVAFTGGDVQSNIQVDLSTPNVASQEVECSFPKDDQEKIQNPSPYDESKKPDDIAVAKDTETDNRKVQPVSLEHHFPSASNSSGDKLSDEHGGVEYATTSVQDEPRDDQNVRKAADMSHILNTAVDSNSSNGQVHPGDEPKPFSTSVDGSEPIYEGEECILDSGIVAHENREPVYEGEVVIAEQGDIGRIDENGLTNQETLSVKQGEIIRNFMKISASQLTLYGLFCLQDKVKERELCVFFRNNHFNTMFKIFGSHHAIMRPVFYFWDYT
ncbi:uncharacterized protein LOC127255950 isoform X2 [Andrographis paniculata]|uniref:uncharacterized protein LOC127255950 isoform X2 n=1 Tax=Andrographis paniculata TaxID=175694 RepID=UPI0021E805AD|nr:uncharacterized protein LOC127255950 isoform X2 [Andrographis paniculata]